MCKKRPGLRCSYHAKKRLAALVKLYKEHPTKQNKEKLVQARHDYYLTPEGQNHLRLKIREAQNNGNSMLEKTLTQELNKVIQERNVIIATNKAMKDSMNDITVMSNFEDIKTPADLVRALLEIPCENLKIPNYSEASRKKALSLHDMKKPQLAHNNCESTGKTITELLKKNLPKVSPENVTLEFTQAIHAANIVNIAGKEYVIDFTARQFAPNDAIAEKISFPLIIEGVENWANTITGWVNAQYGDSLQNVLR